MRYKLMVWTPLEPNADGNLGRCQWIWIRSPAWPMLAGGALPSNREPSPLSRRTPESALKKAAEVSRSSVTELLSNRLGRKNRTLEERETDFGPHIINQIGKTAG